MTKPAFKPQLACDFEESKLKFPLIAMPKIDGVRGINIDGTLTGRSLKQHDNPHVTARFSGEQFIGFDGEIVTEEWTHPDLCRKTSGDLRRKKASTHYNAVWYIFDYIAPHMQDQAYHERLNAAGELVSALQADGIDYVRLVPWELVHNLERLLELEAIWLSMGFEGVIMRDPNAPHKHGRATVKAGSYLRIKRFMDFEVQVTEVTEAMENQNEAKTNELGRTERSTHQENMVPKGMAGMLKARVLADVVWNGKTLMVKDQIIDVGPGNMNHDDRVKFFKNPSLLTTEISKVKFFPHGQKDKPRFPTWVCIRSKEDMGE